MRFTHFIVSAAFLGLASNAFSQTSTSPVPTTAAPKTKFYPRAQSANVDTPRKITRVMRTRNDTITTPAPLYSQQLAAGLGDITAMTIGENGSIYTVDEAGGRIFILSDRHFDGQIDQRRLLAKGFDQPSGITLLGKYLYITDAQAVWRLDPQTSLKTQIASLQNSAARPSPRPIITRRGQLWLGLTNLDNDGVRMISLVPETGKASLISSYENGPVTHLANRGDGQIWAALKNGLQPLTQDGDFHPIEVGSRPRGMLFIGKDTLPEKWPNALQGHILVAQSATAPRQTRGGASNSGGLNIVAIGTEFGALQNTLSVFASGFLKKNQRHAWGTPGALVLDKRGLFIADRWNGTLWLIAYDDRPAPVQRSYADTEPIKLPEQKPSRKPNETEPLRGSQISNTSTITQGSTLKVGSTIIQEYEKAEAEKAAAEKTEAEKSRNDTKTGN